MRHRENPQSGKVPVRTIIAAITMLAGVVLLGFGYFGNQKVMTYTGLALTLSGVMTVLLLGILGAPKGQQ
jgi:hypothetical protein